MRKRIYEIIEISKSGDKLSRIYDFVMLILIILSIVPLAFKKINTTFSLIDKVIVTIFIIDYILRLITADYKYKDKSLKSFLRYPFSFMAIVDLLSILPSLIVFKAGLKSLRYIKLFRFLRLLRIFRILKYSRNVRIILSVFEKSKEALLTVVTFAIGYILLSALIVFNVEPESFKTFFDAVYWATVSLTTMGYGDIYPVTTAGRVVTMFSALFGIAIVALPAGIITAGYMQELEEIRKEKKGRNK